MPDYHNIYLNLNYTIVRKNWFLSTKCQVTMVTGDATRCAKGDGDRRLFATRVIKTSIVTVRKAVIKIYNKKKKRWAKRISRATLCTTTPVKSQGFYTSRWSFFFLCNCVELHSQQLPGADEIDTWMIFKAIRELFRYLTSELPFSQTRR